MPFYQRYWNWNRRPTYRNRRRRNWTWNSRKTFRRKRRYRRVRRSRFFKKKLKTIKLKQWQPEKIRLCKIRGYLELIECGFGRISNNFTMAKESWVPDHEPGGGGWSIQQLNLGNLFTQNQYIMNYWSKTNKGFPLCRYLGCKITLFRQQNASYIFHYNLEEPRKVDKFTYPSYHPYRMLLFKHKILVKSYKDAPHKKKPFKTKFIKPPRQFKNQWYFQQQLSNIPLITFYTTAVDLISMFISPKAQNNNITLQSLNTRFFQHPAFQYSKTSTVGFSPNAAHDLFIWGIPQWEIGTNLPTIKHTTFLGNSMLNDFGSQLNDKTENTYTAKYWGNPFYYEYLTGETMTYITKNSLKTQIEKKDQKPDDSAIKYDPYVVPVRYNPNKDNGTGNIAYWLTTYDVTKKNWDPPSDPDLIIQGFPLWLMLWGFEDYIRKTGKISKLDENAILVIRSNALTDNLPAYVFLNESFINGQGPYDQPRRDLSNYHNTHWYPRWQYQKEAIESILSTGPAVYKPQKDESVQAHMHYDFLFKWGGNPSKMEQLADPNSQPIEPIPNNLLGTNEIIHPTTDPSTFIYSWDVRRDFLTKQATERIKKVSIDELHLLTDGTTTSTDIQPQAQDPQTKTTEEKEKEALLQQLLNIQQYNNTLQQRLRQLKLLTENM